MKKQVLLLAITLVSNALFAQTTTFTGGTSTAWEVDGNWDSGTAPIADQQVEFAADQMAVVSTEVIIGKFKYGTKVGTNLVTVTGSGSLTITDGGWSSVGWSGGAGQISNITIEDGGLMDFGPTHMWATWSAGTSGVIDVAGTLLLLDANSGFGWEGGNQDGTGGMIVRTTGRVRTRNFDNVGDDTPDDPSDNRKWLNGAGFTLSIEGNGQFIIDGDKTTEVTAFGSQITADGDNALLVVTLGADGNTYLTSALRTDTEELGPDLSVESQANLDFSVYPNPANDNITIESKTSISNVKLFNSLGQKVVDVDGKSTIDISVISSGIYVLKALDAKGNVGVQRVVKQ
tara:strand:+ start:686 stop:1720 length:1035 start_codon:yes stop_codon:yes gene_type:complete